MNSGKWTVKKSLRDMFKVHIDFTQLTDKLVFVGQSPGFLSLRDQSADWFAMTGYFEAKPFKQQFVSQLSKSDKHIF